MRIGIVTQSYYPRYGGVTEHVHHQAQELRRRGHEVTIITARFRRGEDTRTAGIERIGHNVLIPFNDAFCDLTVGLRLRRQMRRKFQEHDFEVLHVHSPNSPTLPLLAVQEAACPLVGTFHSTRGRSLLEDLAQPILRPAIARMGAVIAVSRTAMESAALYYPRRFEIIPNGVDVTRFSPAARPFEEHRDPDRVNLLFVGRLDPRKGVHHLIAAMPEVLERTRGRVRLLVVGDSYLRPKLEASVPAAARSHVRFLGHVPSADLPRWYATADIFVTPATGHESFGIVLVEAMASGRAVVASDIPGYRTVATSEVDAVLAPPGDVPALARAISGLALDPERRACIAERGRQRAQDFAWPRVVDRIEAVYRQLLGQPTLVTSAA